MYHCRFGLSLLHLAVAGIQDVGALSPWTQSPKGANASLQTGRPAEGRVGHEHFANWSGVPTRQVNPVSPNDANQARLSDQLLNNFIVIPEHNLLFCYIEKVGCANFNELFRRLRSRYDESQIEGVIWGKNSPRKHRVDRAKLERILMNSSWHKAVFWRDPLERFVSAFLSKCGGAHADGTYHCKDQFRSANVSFAAAISNIAERDLEQLEKGQRINDFKFNKHFRSMGHFCGGLHDTLQFYDTVEELTPATSHEKVADLLAKVGVDPESIPGFDELFPPAHAPPSLSESTETSEFEREHNTRSESKFTSLLPAEWPWQAAILRRHYRSDYNLFARTRSGVSLQWVTDKHHWQT